MAMHPSQSFSCPTLSSTTVNHTQHQQTDNDEAFVVPWIGILANVQRQLVNGRYVGVSGSRERDLLTGQGLHPLKVEPLWNQHGHSGFSLVHFANTWVGFSHLMKFEKAFISRQCSKENYTALPIANNETLYGWPARADDFHQTDVVGLALRKKGDIRTVAEMQTEQDMNHTTLIADLTNRLNSQNQLKMQESLLKLRQKHQQETEELHLTLLAFQRTMITKQGLELEIECLQKTLRIMSHLSAAEDSLAYTKKIADTEFALQEKQTAYAEYSRLYQLFKAAL